MILLFSLYKVCVGMHQSRAKTNILNVNDRIILLTNKYFIGNYNWLSSFCNSAVYEIYPLNLKKSLKKFTSELTLSIIIN